MKRITIEAEFDLFETVYFKGRKDCIPGLVTTLVLNHSDGPPLYGITWSNDLAYKIHFADELEREYQPDFRSHGSED
jgi:hypothetical protein